RSPADGADHRSDDQDRRQDLPAGSEAGAPAVAAGRARPVMVAADKIAVLDFGGQYTQLIARRVREMSVFSEVVSCTQPIEPILTGGYKGIILLSEPSRVYVDDAPLPPKALLDAGITMLGICYGMQAMGYSLVSIVVPDD